MSTMQLDPPGRHESERTSQTKTDDLYFWQHLEKNFS
jgi:hypothetical protein